MKANLAAMGNTVVRIEKITRSVSQFGSRFDLTRSPLSDQAATDGGGGSVASVLLYVFVGLAAGARSVG